MNRKNYVGANLDDATHADLKKFGEETDRSKSKSGSTKSIPMPRVAARSSEANRSRSSIHLTKHDVLRTDYGNHVGEHMALDHFGHC